MARLAIILTALLVAAAGPARAWCEASCLAPAETSSQAHCPSHESASTGLSISATAIDDCPVVDTARPTNTARLELKAALVTIESPQPGSASASHPVAAVVLRVTTVFQRNTPLRI